MPFDERATVRAAVPADRVARPDFGEGRCAFVAVDKTEAGQGLSAVEELLSRGEADFVIAVDASVDLSDAEAVFFHWCANFDPGRDMVLGEAGVGFDATPKLAGDARNGQPVRDFPPPLEMDAETRRKVDERWGEYGLPSVHS